MRWWIDRAGQRVDLSVRRLGERFEVVLDRRSHTVELLAAGPGLFALLCEDGRSYAVAGQAVAANRFRVSLGDRDFEVHLRDPLEREIASAAGSVAGPQEVRAPIPGKVVRVDVAEGDEVSAGQPLLVLEAMKMENQICAEGAGTVEAVVVSPGGTVEGGQVLIVLS
jgi:biotin carboxyl carrier protein